VSDLQHRSRDPLVARVRLEAEVDDLSDALVERELVGRLEQRLERAEVVLRGLHREGRENAASIAEVVVDRADADAGAVRDLLERELLLVSAPRETLRGSAEDGLDDAARARLARRLPEVRVVNG